MKVEVAMLTLDDSGFKAGSIKWDKRKLFYIDKNYDNKNIAAMNLYVSNNKTFKCIKVKLADKHKMKKEKKQVFITDFNTSWMIMKTLRTWRIGLL